MMGWLLDYAINNRTVWFPVSERLPEVRRTETRIYGVMVFVKSSSGRTSVAEYDGERFNHGLELYDGETITHWANWIGSDGKDVGAK